MNIVYYNNCKLFGLRAGDKYRALCVEQFFFGKTEDGSLYMKFTGRSSKTYQGGLHHHKMNLKELKIFAVPELGERDVADCFRKSFFVLGKVLLDFCLQGCYGLITPM